MNSTRIDDFSNDAGETRTRFVVGVDLGTTNCAVSYVDLDDASRRVSTFLIPQAVAVGVVEERPTLPSFFCRSADAPKLPWNDSKFDFSAKKGGAADGRVGVVGVFARDFGVASPASFVSSAKSWLCHSGVDRTAKILPWGADAAKGADEKSENFEKSERTSERNDASRRRWSPIEISSFYLAHLRAAWNARFPDFPLETQDVVLTIPASFDETARELTIRAAKFAGLPKIALVEEPQAAFYSRIERRENDWTNFVRPGDKILVCDVGGGTTDFALIYALERKANDKKDALINNVLINNEKETERDADRNNDGNVRFYRVAVGDHLILGGDNLDLALFRLFERKLAEKRSTPATSREKAILLRESRETKEFFLSGPANENDAENADVRDDLRRVVLPGTGSKLIGGGVALDVSRREVEKILLDGFFPRVPLESVPTRRRVGVREIALPYAPDPAITKYLAAFLTSKRDAGLELERAGVFNGATIGSKNDDNDKKTENDATSPVDRARPDVVLFNGGAFESEKLRARIVDSLIDWFGGPDRSWRPVVLRNENLYLAVARGAAYYGLVRRGLGTRIGASLARSYYVGVAVDENLSKKTKNSENSTSKTSGTRTAKAVCLLPARCEPGDEVSLPQTFELAVDRPVSFPIFVSSVRTTDAPGELVDVDPDEFRETPPIQTALKTRSQAKKDAKTIRARIVARPTEIGTIELFLQEVLSDDAASRRRRASRWALQFDVRGATQTDWEASSNEGEEEGVLDESLVDAARRVLTAAFASDDELRKIGESTGERIERIEPRDVFRRLAEAVGRSKNDFPILLLRRSAEATLELEPGRRRKPAVEARWLNWLGFALRPGFGAATDDWRVEQTWKKIGGNLAFRTPECRTQYWILWRRVASGLSAGRQRTLAEPLLGNLRDLRRQLVDGRGKGSDLDLASQEGAEIWRLLGALELLAPETKEEIGSIILDVLPKKKIRPVRDALVWALGRLGARVPFSAPLDRVVSAKIAEIWATRFLESIASSTDSTPNSTDFFALAQLTRKSGETSLDVAESVRDAVSAFLTKNGAADSTTKALESRTRVVDEETQATFGESLPLGLRWNEN